MIHRTMPILAVLLLTAGFAAQAPVSVYSLSKLKAREVQLDSQSAGPTWDLIQDYQLGGHYGAARRLARTLVRHHSDHLPARTLLGYMKVGDQWLTKNKAMKAMGYVRLRGKWVSQEEADRVKGQARARFERSKLRARISDYSQDLMSPSRKRRDDALAGLQKISKEHQLPSLATQAEQLHAAMGRTGVVTAEVRLQQSTLLGFETRSVGLGNGSSVRLQLPRTRSVSLGTTVNVPIGR